jgi:hypothetical protein
MAPVFVKCTVYVPGSATSTSEGSKPRSKALISIVPIGSPGWPADPVALGPGLPDGSPSPEPGGDEPTTSAMKTSANVATPMAAAPYPIHRPMSVITSHCRAQEGSRPQRHPEGRGRDSHRPDGLFQTGRPGHPDG